MENLVFSQHQKKKKITDLCFTFSSSTYLSRKTGRGRREPVYTGVHGPRSESWNNQSRLCKQQQPELFSVFFFHVHWVVTHLPPDDFDLRSSTIFRESTCSCGEDWCHFQSQNANKDSSQLNVTVFTEPSCLRGPPAWPPVLFHSVITGPRMECESCSSNPQSP